MHPRYIPQHVTGQAVQYIKGNLEEILRLDETDVNVGVHAIITDAPASQLVFDGKYWDGVLRGVTQQQLDELQVVNLAEGAVARINTETGTETITWSRA